MRDDRGGRPPRPRLVLAITVVVAAVVAAAVVYGAVTFERSFGFALLVLAIASGSLLGYWATAGWANRRGPEDPDR